MRLADFEGLWRLERRIEDRLGPGGLMTGEARLTPDAEGLVYDETGALRLGDGAPFAATQRYLWRESGDGIELRFADGRFFHRFALARPEAEHPCGADLYKVRYDFAAWPDWRAEWRVTGPRKDYVMATRYMPFAARA